MDPQLGVFLWVDPVTAYQKPIDQFNRYRYGNGNPDTFSDPDGRQAIPMPMPYITPIPVPSAQENIQRNADASGGDRESGPTGRPTSRPTERPTGRDTVRRGRDGRPIPNRFPDRPLPTKPNGEPAPDPDAAGPHTQLGQRDGRNGKYDQAREFDGRGRPVKTLTLLITVVRVVIRTRMNILMSRVLPGALLRADQRGQSTEVDSHACKSVELPNHRGHGKRGNRGQLQYKRYVASIAFGCSLGIGITGDSESTSRAHGERPIRGVHGRSVQCACWRTASLGPGHSTFIRQRRAALH